MNNQDIKKRLQECLDKSIEEEKQLQKETETLVDMQWEIKGYTSSHNRHVVIDITTQIERNLESLQKIRRKQACLRRGLLTTEETKNV